MNIFKKKPIIALAPMAGWTNSAYRLLCKKFGADLLYTEMVSAYGLYYEQKNKRTKKHPSFDLAKFNNKEKPVLVQIFGNDPEIMKEAAIFIEQKLKPAGIDINMGCPAKKEVKRGYGCALMLNPGLACEIVKQIKNNVKIPVTVKIRLGYYKSNEILKFSKELESAGADMLCIHGRTFKQKFTGPVNYEMIKKVKQSVKIPVIANGGIKSPEEAKKVFDFTKCDGIAIGQASWGRPWIFQQINDYLSKGKYKQYDIKDIKKIAKEHINFFQKYNPDSNLFELKKNLPHYFKGLKNKKKINQEIFKSKNYKELIEIIDPVFRERLG